MPNETNTLLRPAPVRERLISASVRFALLAAVPALLTWLTLRYAVAPLNSLTALPWEGVVSALVDRHPVAAVVLVFLLFSLLARYWVDAVVPGWLASSALPRADRSSLSRAERKTYLEAEGFHAQVVRLLARAKASTSSSDLREQVELGLATLAKALEKRPPDLTEVQRAAEALAEQAEPLLERSHKREAIIAGLGIAVAATLAILANSRLGQIYEVRTESMLPTLHPHVRVAVNRAAVGGAGGGRQKVPRRGDVIAFRRDLGEGTDDYIKRVIGLPGDRVDMDGHIPIINGWAVPSCPVGFYTRAGEEGVTDGWLRVEFLEDRAYLVLFHLKGTPFKGELVVPDGEVFVLGDNRARSRDSRTYNVGYGGGQPIAGIVGRVDRFLFERTPSGEIGFERFLEPLLGARLHEPHVDLTELEVGIQKCLADRPKDTYPPAPSSGNVALNPVGSQG